MRTEVIVQALGVEQYFHSVEADAATISVLLLIAAAPIKRIKDVLKLLLGEWFASIFDSQLILVASNFYYAPYVAVAHRI